MRLHRLLAVALCVTAMLAGTIRAAEAAESLKKGTPDIKHAGKLAFGPDGVLFIGDSLGAAVFAVDTNDRPGSPATGEFKIEGINEKIASMLGIEAKQLRINDLAVNPASGNAYLSTSRGQGTEAEPVLLRVNRSGKIEDVSLKGIPFAKAELPNAPDANAKDRRGQPQRLLTITDLTFADGKVFVAGLSNEEFASTLRVIPFPFTKSDRGTGVKIFHGAHGRFETNSPVRTFTPFAIEGETHLLAAYTCTPLVKFPVKELKPGAQVTGTTIAELGNRNSPLDMVVYKKGDKNYILMTNTSRGVMKITTEGIDKVEPITKPVGGGGTKGLTYETIKSLQGVEEMSRLDDQHALILVRKDGALNLETIELP